MKRYTNEHGAEFTFVGARPSEYGPLVTLADSDGEECDLLPQTFDRYFTRVPGPLTRDADTAERMWEWLLGAPR